MNAQYTNGPQQGSRKQRTAALLLVLLAGVGAIQAQGLIKPAGGERYHTGQTCLITWDGRKFPGNVEIALWEGTRDRWTIVASSVPGSIGSYAWPIPPGVSSTACRLRVRSLGINAASAFSDGFFCIRTFESAAKAVRTLSQPASDITVQIQPNPAQDRVRITSSSGEIKTVTVTDASGRLVVSEEFENTRSSTRECDVAKLPAGLYVLAAFLADGRVSCQRLIIQR